VTGAAMPTRALLLLGLLTLPLGACSSPASAGDADAADAGHLAHLRAGDAVS